MVRRKTGEKQVGNERCRPAIAPPTQTERSQVQEMPCMNAACARDVVDLQSCRMTGVASLESQSQSATLTSRLLAAPGEDQLCYVIG